jgi:hypothetical protein
LDFGLPEETCLSKVARTIFFILELKAANLCERAHTFRFRVFLDREQLFQRDGGDVGVRPEYSHEETVLEAQDFLFDKLKFEKVFLA